MNLLLLQLLICSCSPVTIDQYICELTNTSLLLVDSSSLYSSLFFVPHIETVLEIMKLGRIKDVFLSFFLLVRLP